MRIWTVHPRYLDRLGLTALWREALLAQAVLLGKTRGYRNHPQLIRFHAHRRPLAAISCYLWVVYEEACRRGYGFDKTKIREAKTEIKIVETEGQLLFEWEHLKKKLKRRSPECFHEIEIFEKPSAHPMFKIVPGELQNWEKTKR
ncbi:MAG: DNA lyase [Deltaproteobacteria bacterium]|nr:DNA lyase [Deltaproteobacteria bacterium]